MKTTLRLVLPLLLCAVVVGCKTKSEPAPPPPPPPPPPAAPPPPPPPPPSGYTPEDLDTVPCLRQREIFFDFDQDTLRSEFQTALGCHAKYLRDRPSARITLEGHADERGSRDYNLGLGERRANTVSQALQANGGSAGQLTVVSYGEERPACTQSGEDCWARNRRVQIVYTAR